MKPFETVELGQIYIKDMRLHAFHGVLAQERVVGNDYLLNLCVEYPLLEACISDSVDDTLNYAVAADIIKKEMARPSKLLENVAYRIAKAIKHAYPSCSNITIDIRKLAPPMFIDCDGAGVRITL